MAENKFKFKKLTPDEINKLSPSDQERYFLNEYFYRDKAKNKKKVPILPNKTNYITLKLKNITFGNERLKKAWIEIVKTKTGKDLKNRIEKASSPKIRVVENHSCQNEHFEPGYPSYSDGLAGRGQIRDPHYSVVNVDLSVDYFVSGTINSVKGTFWTNPKYYSVLVHEIAHALQYMEKGLNNITEDFAIKISNNYRSEINELKGKLRVGHGAINIKGPNCKNKY